MAAGSELAQPQQIGVLWNEHVAAAAGGQAMGRAVAASLNHVAAGLVTAQAGDRAAVFRVFALAHPAKQIELAAGDAILGAGQRAHSVAEGLAQILQRAAGHLVFARADELHAHPCTSPP